MYASTEHNDTSSKTQEMVEECAGGREGTMMKPLTFGSEAVACMYVTTVSILLRAVFWRSGYVRILTTKRGGQGGLWR